MASIKFDLCIQEYKNDVPLPRFVPRPSFGSGAAALDAPLELEAPPAASQRPLGRQDDSDLAQPRECNLWEEKLGPRLKARGRTTLHISRDAPINLDSQIERVTLASYHTWIGINRDQ